MILWIVLFLGIITASFSLALRSMRTYQEKPEHFSYPYALYLIQNRRNLTEKCLQQLYEAILPKRALISFERLSKGSRQALVIYGPTPLLEPFIGDLGLLELEDYIAQTSEVDVQALEFSSQDGSGKFSTDQALSQIVDDLQANEECWLQFILQPLQSGLEVVVQKAIRNMANESYQIAAARQQKMKKTDHLPSSPETWSLSIRALLISPDSQRREQLTQSLTQHLHNHGLVKLPQKFTSAELLKHYRKRTMIGGKATTIIGHPTLQLLLHQEPGH